MTANKTEVTPKELTDAMEKCRNAKEVWREAVRCGSFSARREADARDEYERAEEEFVVLIAAVAGEK